MQDFLYTTTHHNWDALLQTLQSRHAVITGAPCGWSVLGCYWSTLYFECTGDALLQTLYSRHVLVIAAPCSCSVLGCYWSTP